MEACIGGKIDQHEFSIDNNRFSDDDDDQENVQNHGNIQIIHYKFKEASSHDRPNKIMDRGMTLNKKTYESSPFRSSPPYQPERDSSEDDDDIDLVHSSAFSHVPYEIRSNLEEIYEDIISNPVPTFNCKSRITIEGWVRMKLRQSQKINWKRRYAVIYDSNVCFLKVSLYIYIYILKSF